MNFVYRPIRHKETEARERTVEKGNISAALRVRPVGQYAEGEEVFARALGRT